MRFSEIPLRSALLDRAPELASDPAVVGRVQRIVAAVFAPWVAILVPDRRVGVEVAAGRYGWPLIIVILCAGLAAVAIGTRLDLGPEVLAENAAIKPRPTIVSGADHKPAEVKTDREIDEATAHRTSVTRVKLGLDAGLGTPGRVLLLALAIFLLGRFVGGTPTMTRAMAAASLVSLPGAVRSAVTAMAAWNQTALASADLDSLVPTARLPVPTGHPALERLLGGVDLFTGWSVVILGFALAAAADLKATKAVVASAVGFVLYVLVTGAIMGGGGPPPGAGN